MRNRFLLNLSLFLFVTAILGLSLAVRIDLHNLTETALYIIEYIRLPKSLCAMFCGATLALCGLIFQCVFKNPMADSYILGISSGASCSVALFTILLGNLKFGTPVYALFGSFFTAFFLFLLSKGNSLSLLLSGIATNFFLSAMTTLLIYISGQQMDRILFWTMGSFSATDWTKTIILGITTLFILSVCCRNASKMDIMLMDDATALSSGIVVSKKRMELLICSSVATAICVSCCGIIGFVGLMSAHIVRLIIGPKHKKLVIPTMLFGSAIMLLSDFISTNILFPSELPVGVITSVLGAPVLFFVLKKGGCR